MTETLPTVEFPCPECAAQGVTRTFPRTQALGLHRRQVHGIVGTGKPNGTKRKQRRTESASNGSGQSRTLDQIIGSSPTRETTHVPDPIEPFTEQLNVFLPALADEIRRRQGFDLRESDHLITAFFELYIEQQ